MILSDNVSSSRPDKARAVLDSVKIQVLPVCPPGGSESFERSLELWKGHFSGSSPPRAIP